MTRAEDLRVCGELGVDAVGLNLWSGSKRYLSVPEAAAMIAEAGPEGAKPVRVAVFVDLDAAALDALAEAITALDLDLLQPHGEGSPEQLAAVAALASAHEIGWIWVVRGTPDLATLRVPEPRPAWILLDAAVPGFGGAGQQTDWSWAAEAVAALAPIPVWLAGGIDPSNVAAAITTVRPAGIDLASGAEMPGATRGEKQRERIAALVSACRGL